ncbi:hypothetical protein [Halocatena halophila]|uniref:hypothetical protein n=1 Tax=Halocatena halophila TaxID=2814576 RepID=UPI002ED09934
MNQPIGTVAHEQLAAHHPDRRLETNVEVYTAVVLDGIERVERAVLPIVTLEEEIVVVGSAGISSIHRIIADVFSVKQSSSFVLARTM